MNNNSIMNTNIEYNSIYYLDINDIDTYINENNYPLDLIYLADKNYISNINNNIIIELNNYCILDTINNIDNIKKYNFYKNIINNLKNNNYKYIDIYYNIGAYYIINNYINKIEIEMNIIRKIIFIRYRFNIIYNYLINIFSMRFYDTIKLTVPKIELDNIQKLYFYDLEDVLKINNETCIICYMKYDINDIVRLTNCKHIYHIDCIDKWLTEISYKCPLCRNKVSNYIPNLKI